MMEIKPRGEITLVHNMHECVSLERTKRQPNPDGLVNEVSLFYTNQPWAKTARIGYTRAVEIGNPALVLLLMMVRFHFMKGRRYHVAVQL